jgi:CSLREA domain-containing protein
MKPYRMLFTFALAVIALALSPISPVRAAANTTFTVNSTADVADKKPGDGKCETKKGNGVCTLRAAIQETNALGGKHTVTLPAGTFALLLNIPDEDNAASGDLDIKSNLTLKGKGASKTILDGLQYDRVLDVFNGSIKVSGVTVKNGTADYGGGIRVNQAATLNLNKTTVRANQASYHGGGLYVGLNARIKITSSRFQDNTAVQVGGGMYFAQSVSESIAKTTITNNSALQGAGLSAYYADPSVTTTTIADNVATAAGGGISIAYGSLNLVNSTVSHNDSIYGGGITTNHATVRLFNATIVENTIHGEGSGGGIWGASSATIYWQNTIIAGNTYEPQGFPDNCSATLNSAGYNLMDEPVGCTFTGATSLDNTYFAYGTDLKLGALQNNGGSTDTHALSAGSLGIDAGNPTGCTDHLGATLKTDQRSSLRPTNGDNQGGARCDIGAFEK